MVFNTDRRRMPAKFRPHVTSAIRREPVLSSQPPGPRAYPPARGPAPIDQPQYEATIEQAVSRFWRKYAVFSGRASRSEYWWWALVSFVVSVGLQIVGRLIFAGGLLLTPGRVTLDMRSLFLPLLPSLVWSLATLIPSIALAVRRLHDTNRSGWWYLISLPGLVAVPFELIGLASIDPARLAAGDFASVAIGPLVAGGVLFLLGTAGSIVLLVFFVLMPDPRGARFDAVRSQGLQDRR